VACQLINEFETRIVETLCMELHEEAVFLDQLPREKADEFTQRKFSMPARTISNVCRQVRELAVAHPKITDISEADKEAARAWIKQILSTRLQSHGDLVFDHACNASPL